jgi:integrase
MRMLLLVAASTSAVLCAPIDGGQQRISREEARQIARDAYIYAYPLVLMQVSRQVATNVAQPTGLTAPINQFAHGREFPIDVSKEPLVVSIPDSAGVEFPVSIRGLFRPHYVTWSEQQMIEFHAPEHLRNVVRIITETGLRVYKELTAMKKDQVDLENAVVWILDSKTPNGVAEAPLTRLSAQAFQDQLRVADPGPYLFPSDKNSSGHQTTLKTVWHKTLRRANIPYFRIYDLRSTYATRLSAGGVADEWVTQMLRQGDAKVFKKYSQMKLQMKREALEKINRHANEAKVFDTAKVQ